ncbi:MAG: tyrosine--tRNA ligase [Oscillospiraceae bacterium]|nr:tyrosine--tRNA ligase [Oscillospiraceae bacterium]
MTIFEELKRRGLIAQMSHEEEIAELLSDTSKPVKFYIGFDATADSLHIGGLLQLITMRRLQLSGHHPIALLGTATTLIGDPTGKDSLRQMLTHEAISHNADCFAEQMSRILNLKSDDYPDLSGRVSGGIPAEIVKNGDWFADIKYLEFLRDVGRHFSVNKMLTAECFKTRLEKGLSFLEFNYMLLQSYDFLHLYRTKGITMQFGGNDQWSNILSGADLVRRIAVAENITESSAYAMTFSLLLTKDGKKMGKTEKGAIWLSADKCSPYDFFQYFRNIDDGDVINTLKMMTFVPIEEIENMEKTLSGKELNSAKELLAFELTKMVHGEDEAIKTRESAKSVFVSGGDDDNMPTVTVIESEIGILDLLVQSGLCKSKREARTTVEQGAASINREKNTDVNAVITIDDFVIVQKGKKNFVKVII